MTTQPNTNTTRPEVSGGVVVIAEDSDDTRELYVECFTEAGFAVEAATNGGEAVFIGTARPVAAYVIDLQMPIMDGWEAIRRIREAFGKEPYILAVSGHIHADEPRNAAYDAGADDVVAKPIEPNVLITIVRAALRTPRVRA